MIKEKSKEIKLVKEGKDGVLDISEKLDWDRKIFTKKFEFFNKINCIYIFVKINYKIS